MKYSLHQWGMAADFFVDRDQDGNMDDLNRDGRVGRRDAVVIYNMIDEMTSEQWYKPFLGGLANYPATRSHGPFIHVDVRGYRARWGQ